ncbi:MAG: helix-turn-helix domain-containing protein [Pseudomonadota bacterium]
MLVDPNASNFQRTRTFEFRDSIDRADWIKLELRDRGLTVRALAKEVGVTPALVSDVIAGNRKSPRVKSAIAILIGIDADQLWPPNQRRNVIM